MFSYIFSVYLQGHIAKSEKGYAWLQLVQNQVKCAVQFVMTITVQLVESQFDFRRAGEQSSYACNSSEDPGS